MILRFTPKFERSLPRFLSRFVGLLALYKAELTLVITQGEENISSVSMSFRGDMLAVSTVSGVKIFYLRSHKSSGIDSIKVQKAEVPRRLSSHGSKYLQFSPDSRWLLIVRYDNSIYVHRITDNPGTEPRRHILEQAAELHRLTKSRPMPKARHGTYGDYEKCIVRSAWSGDSRILVVSDLRGNLDSWVLEGYEDLTQGNDEIVGRKSPASAYKDNGDDDDDKGEEESDQESHPNVILGQHWIRVPQSHSLPRLPSFPLLMSFRPAKPCSSEALPNGNIAIHPTRRNPNPYSRDLPKDDDRLFVVTSLHEVHEYQILAGKLSDWSRRNPSSALPREFRAVRDRAMGCVWDISGVRDRVWIYGSAWLWMFDLARDFPASDFPEVLVNGESQNETKSSKKRKRHQDRRDQKELMKATTGAGSKIPDEEVNLGTGNKMRKSAGLEQSEGKWVTLKTVPHRARVASGGDDDDDDSGSSDDPASGKSALVSLRRTENRNTTPPHRNGASEPVTIGDAAVLRSTEDGPAYWHTYKYRPILGMVMLDGGLGTDDHGRSDNEDSKNDFRSGIEVALVERPEWEIDFPPRYHGDQEWEK